MLERAPPQEGLEGGAVRAGGGAVNITRQVTNRPGHDIGLQQGGR